MGKVIYSFVKIFQDKQHREEFLNGSLYMNRLKFFKQFEEQSNNNRGDVNEAVSGWYQPGEISIRIGGYDIPSSDIAAPVVVQLNKFNHINIFCLFSLNNNGFEKVTEDSLGSFREHIKLGDEVVALGEFAVIVTHASKFLEKVQSAIKRERYAGRMGLVDYYEPGTYNGSFSDIEAVFKKQIQFYHQKEYRIAIDRGIFGDDAYRLEIGDIRDICKVIQTVQINSKVEVKWLGAIAEKQKKSNQSG